MKPDKKHVVLAEDDESIRIFIRIFLTRMGFIVFEAKDGLEAISAIRSLKPELIVTDLSMPRVSGLELIRLVRSDDLREIKSIPIIAISGAAEVMQKHALEMGASMVLKKPIHRRTLTEAIEQLLQK